MRRSLPRASVFILVFAASLTLAATAQGDTYSLSPTEDVSCRSDYPGTAGNGASTLLYVGGPIAETSDYWTTYIKFNLSGLSSQGTLNSATLYMTCHSHSGSSVNVSAYEVISETGTWDEDFMSEQTAASVFTVSGSASATTTVNATGTAFSWGVTTAASNHLGGDFTIVLKEQNQPSSGKWAKFYSKDQTTAAKPYLAVTYTPVEPFDPRGYIDFDPTLSIENLIVPDLYNAFDAYVTVDQMTNGLTTCSFAMSVTPGMSDPPVFENLLPGGLSVGDWETGITVASTECVGFGGGPVNVGVLHLLYLGVPGDIMLIDHPDYPRWVEDCESPGMVSYYCVLSHGGVGKDPIAGDCVVSPVESRSWSGIKAMFR